MDEAGASSSAAAPSVSAAAAEHAPVDRLALADGEEDVEEDEEDVLRQRIAEIRKNPAEMRRYRCFRRSRIQPQRVAQQIQPLLGATPASEEVCICLATAAKMFVGEVVEEAREIMAQHGATGPVTPAFIRLAYQQQLQRGDIPYAKRSRLVHPV